MKQLTYTYHIDLDERGYFRAHVENSRGRTIVSYDLPVIYSQCAGCDDTFDVSNAKLHECTVVPDAEIYDVENWDILSPDWGIMKHNQDVRGLGKHLRECKVIPQNAELVLVK